MIPHPKTTIPQKENAVASEHQNGTTIPHYTFTLLWRQSNITSPPRCEITPACQKLAEPLRYRATAPQHHCNGLLPSCPAYKTQLRLISAWPDRLETALLLYSVTTSPSSRTIVFQDMFWSSCVHGSLLRPSRLQIRTHETTQFRAAAPPYTRNSTLQRYRALVIAPPEIGFLVSPSAPTLTRSCPCAHTLWRLWTLASFFPMRPRVFAPPRPRNCTFPHPASPRFRAHTPPRNLAATYLCHRTATSSIRRRGDATMPSTPSLTGAYKHARKHVLARQLIPNCI